MSLDEQFDINTNQWHFQVIQSINNTSLNYSDSNVKKYGYICWNCASTRLLWSSIRVLRSSVIFNFLTQIINENPIAKRTLTRYYNYRYIHSLCFDSYLPEPPFLLWFSDTGCQWHPIYISRRHCVNSSSLHFLLVGVLSQIEDIQRGYFNVSYSYSSFYPYLLCFYVLLSLAVVTVHHHVTMRV